VLNLVLHSADISNPCKPFNTSKRWSNLILEEFFMQGDVEKQHKLPVSPNCDRATTEQSQLTLNFIDFIVAPVFVGIRAMLPKVHYIIEILAHNRGQWTKLCDKLVEESKTGSETHKSEERNRWARRLQSFNQSIAPKGDAELLNAAAQAVKDARAAEPRRASLAVEGKLVKGSNSVVSTFKAISPTASGSAAANTNAGTNGTANGNGAHAKPLPAPPGGKKLLPALPAVPGKK